MASNIPFICGVRVQRGAFSEGRDITLFKRESGQRISIIFGHNGSGKSTIAREIKDIREGNGSGYFYDSDCKIIDLDDADSTRIRVFSEEYIESKTRIDDDGIEAFAMLGEQVEVADEIKKIDEQINSVSAENEKLRIIIDELNSGKNSLIVLEEEAKKAAKDGGWGSRAEEVDGKAPNLTSNRWSEICKSASGQSRESLEKQFNDKLVEYKKASGAGDSHLPGLSLIEVKRHDETRVLELLAKPVEDPTLSDREKRILRLVQNGHQVQVEESAKIFSSPETDACPMCLREISTQEKTSIVDSVHKVLSKEVDEFKAELRQAHLQEIVQQSVADQVSDSLKTNLLKVEQKVINLVKEYNNLILERERNVYSPKTIDPLGLSEALQDLNEVIKSINQEIASINKAIDEKAEIHEALLDLNNKIAAADALPKIKESKKASEDLAKAQESQKKNKDTLKNLRQRKVEQQARMQNVDIAVDVINAYLANVYFDTRKFQLQPNGNMYKVILNGQTVKPKDISTGERNILALCYFFAEGGKDREKNHEDDDPQYLVLDDPISSFDMENRIGVCSLIRERSEHLLRSNPESRITVMTHDGGVVEELANIFADISECFDGKKIKTDLFELRGRSSEPRGKKSSEYVVLLQRAYLFASAEDVDPNESYVIGNILRRVLEGYSTFNYGIGMSRLSRDPDLRERLGDQLPFLDRVMYRLAFNDASHMEKRVKTLNPANAFERYSDEEKKGCAQCVMVILDKLDPIHLKKHLGSCQISQQEIENNLRKWSGRFTPVAS